MERWLLPLSIPLGAALFVVVVGGGLGGIFTLLAETSLGNYGAIVIGIGLVVSVPAVGWYLTRR
ncbi:MAG: hypothetical protein HY666_03475 [Chloroflexi bacterium]|nr:hypothetical protein [Chloroflexota bacterium]